MESHEDCPRSLRSPAAIAERRKLLAEPHVAPLAAFVARLRVAQPGWEFPEFDPLDGGVEADILFLFEKPGPKTSVEGGGSGFISRNNDDPTAEATFRFMTEAGLPRRRTVTWNLVPGWNGTRRLGGEELRVGMQSLRELIGLLPRLKAMVLVGRKAQRARPWLGSLGLRVVESPHPSPLVRASQPEAWRAIPAAWAQAAS